MVTLGQSLPLASGHVLSPSGWSGRSRESKVRWPSRTSRDSEPASEEHVPDIREVCTGSAVTAGP